MGKGVPVVGLADSASSGLHWFLGRILNVQAQACHAKESIGT
jgi:hypothetical protein